MPLLSIYDIYDKHQFQMYGRLFHLFPCYTISLIEPIIILSYLKFPGSFIFGIDDLYGVLLIMYQLKFMCMFWDVYILRMYLPKLFFCILLFFSYKFFSAFLIKYCVVLSFITWLILLLVVSLFSVAMKIHASVFGVGVFLVIYFKYLACAGRLLSVGIIMFSADGLSCQLMFVKCPNLFEVRNLVK